MVRFDTARTQEHAGTRCLVASQLRKRRVTPALNNALEVKYRLSMTDQIQVFIHRGSFRLLPTQERKRPIEIAKMKHGTVVGLLSSAGYVLKKLLAGRAV